MARKKDNPLLSSQPAMCVCGGKVVWRNERLSLCVKCYVEQICPQITARSADIVFQRRLREVEDWIAKHPEFKTNRSACMHILKKRNLTHVLPESVR